MSTATAIGLVSESLRNLLLGEMNLAQSTEITILAPDETATSPRINLFLYKIQENPILTNMDWRVKPGDPSRLVPPPLSLNLFYLMTPYAPNDAQTGNSTAHAILGDAMRVFYEHPMVPQSYLANGLDGSGEEIKIMLNTLDLDELSRVWSTFTQPFRLSVLYEISVVQLDMLDASEQPMAKRVRQIGVPEVQAAKQPPIIEDVAPKSGTAGTTITCHGRQLDGWRAYVTILQEVIVDGQAITGNSFTFTLPVDLPAGFHEILIDISHLHQRSFLVEVTP